MDPQEGAEVVANQNASQSEEDAAFLAEMASTENGDAVAPAVAEPAIEQETEAKTDEPAAQADKPAAEVVEPAVEPEPAEPVREEVIPGYTKEELSASLALLPKLQKALDSTNGTYGKRLDEQQRIIDEMRNKQAAAVNKMTPESLKRLSKEFPELASLLAEDLSEVMSTTTSAVDLSQIEQMSTKVSDLEQRLAKKDQEERQRELDRTKRALTKAHPDWDKIALYDAVDGKAQWRNPQFGEWVSKQDAEVQRRLISEVDADYLSEQLTAFKEAIKPRAVKQEKIKNAVLPEGGGRQVAAAPEDEEEAAFRAEMAKR